LHLRLGIQGHRGARGLFPENTLDGFLAAAALGVSAFELDVGMTADGVVVVHHDPALNPDIARDADGRWLEGPRPLLHSLTFAVLQSFDVGRLRPGSPTAALFPDQVPRDGSRVPTLAAVLNALPNVHFTIEVKTLPPQPEATALPEALADATLTVIDAAGAGGRVTVEAFDWRIPRYIRPRRPDISLGWLTRPETASHLWWDTDPLPSVASSVAREGGPIWAPFHATLTEAEVAEAHDHGLLVLPWTVNDLADMQRLIAWGVDGLISDRPDLALAAL
jgi:glycerophosphoryl diester phosphodiesterase